ncbi:MAG: hypothetical protein NZP72_11210 [Geminicoccaceae bacterium]|nr:hypothetical protein [Geminicoccaceae bacterium]
MTTVEPVQRALPPAEVSPPRTEPHEVARERVRGVLAVVLVAVFAGAISASFLFFWLAPQRFAELKDFVPLVLTPVTSVVSAVLGFYYGAQARRED